MPIGNPAMAVRKTPTKGLKPGEQPFKLELDTKEVLNLKWEKNMGSTYSEIKITNPFKEPHTFKVKTTDRDIFRVRPPMGSIDPKSSISLKVIQHAQDRPAPGSQAISLLHKKCTDEDQKKNNWPMVWAKDNKCEGIIRIPVEFVDPCGQATSHTPSAQSSTAKK